MSNPLDKMAENARELGLDYEPAQQQEPVAWVCYGAPGKRDIDFEEADINRLPIGTQLYTSPPAQRTWVGLTDEQKDVERYRWLRNPTSDVSLVLDKRTKWVPPDDAVPGVGGYWEYEYRAGEELDMEIDRAIEAKLKEKNA